MTTSELKKATEVYIKKHAKLNLKNQLEVKFVVKSFRNFWRLIQENYDKPRSIKISK